MSLDINFHTKTIIFFNTFIHLISRPFGGGVCLKLCKLIDPWQAMSLPYDILKWLTVNGK